jgi:hypothetical protein
MGMARLKWGGGAAMALRSCVGSAAGAAGARFTVLLAVALLVAALAGVQSAAASTVLASVDSSGTQANSSSEFTSVSDDGRYVAFFSMASNLVAGDTNGVADIFVRDTVNGTTTRVSVDSSGTQGNYGAYYFPSISGDGRYVAFTSAATNLVSGDTNSRSDAFVHDMVSGATTRVSLDSSGAQVNDESDYPSISDDGRYVAFFSIATNLVSGDTNGTWDVFVRDRTDGTTVRASVDSSGTQANSGSYYPRISANGRYVVYHSGATNLVASDTNGHYDIFMRDLVTSSTALVSVTSSATQGDSDCSWSTVSSDGRYVTFSSGATNMVSGDANGSQDIFVRDRTGGTTTRVSVDTAGTEANGSSYNAAVSADGRYVVFATSASNLVSGDTNGDADVLVRDLLAQTTTCASVDSSGTPADGASYYPAISGDGAYVGFESDAALVPSDTNGMRDIFVHDMADSTAPSTTISTLPSGWSTSNLSFSLTATDPGGSGVAHTYYGLNAAATTAYTTTVTVSTQGTTTIAYRSVDASGNAETTNTATVKIDKTAPATSDDHVASYAATATIDLSPTDAHSGVETTRYRLDSAAVATGTSVTTTATGSHTLAYSSTDVAGNSETTKTITFTVGSGGGTPATLLRTTSMSLTGRTSVRAGRTYKLKIWLSPRSAPGSVRLSVKCVNHGRTVTSKTVTVRLKNGVGTYRFKPYHHGTWRFSARYGGGCTGVRTFTDCSATKSVSVW